MANRTVVFIFIFGALLPLSLCLTDSEVREVQSDLRTIGWPLAVDGQYGPVTERTVKRFQYGWTYKDLTIDGIAGPNTRVAIKSCLSKGGKASPNFKYSEFKSKGNGEILVRRELLRALEALRSAKGGVPLSIISGYRDPDYNTKIGGATYSQHMYGRAADIPSSYGASYSFVKGLRKFTGIGRYRCNSIVTHVDVRPDRTTTSPANWYYEC